jgi:hypothetical protein
MKPEAVEIERKYEAGAISGFQIAIPHRSPELTRTAFTRAAELTKGLDARVRLIEIQVIPYRLPLEIPVVSQSHSIRRIRLLAEESTVPISPEIVYARDWEDGLRRSLVPGSVVLFAIKKRWWRTQFREKRIAGRLRKAGHQVVWIEL